MAVAVRAGSKVASGNAHLAGIAPTRARPGDRASPRVLPKGGRPFVPPAVPSIERARERHPPKRNQRERTMLHGRVSSKLTAAAEMTVSSTNWTISLDAPATSDGRARTSAAKCGASAPCDVRVQYLPQISVPGGHAMPAGQWCVHVGHDGALAPKDMSADPHVHAEGTQRANAHKRSLVRSQSVHDAVEQCVHNVCACAVCPVTRAHGGSAWRAAASRVPPANLQVGTLPTEHRCARRGYRAKTALAS